MTNWFTNSCICFCLGLERFAIAIIGSTQIKVLKNVQRKVSLGFIPGTIFFLDLTLFQETVFLAVDLKHNQTLRSDQQRPRFHIDLVVF